MRSLEINPDRNYNILKDIFIWILLLILTENAVIYPKIYQQIFSILPLTISL